MTTPDYAGLSRRLGALAYHIQQTGTADGQDAQTCLEVDYALRALLESKEALERERDQLLDKLHCMCGSPIDHSAWEGHTPVSVYDYSLDQERSRAEAAEAKLAEARKALEPFAEDYEKRSRLAPGPDIDHWPIGDSSLIYRHLRIAHELIYPQTEKVEQ